MHSRLPGELRSPRESHRSRITKGYRQPRFVKMIVLKQHTVLKCYLARFYRHNTRVCNRIHANNLDNCSLISSFLTLKALLSRRGARSTKRQYFIYSQDSPDNECVVPRFTVAKDSLRGGHERCHEPELAIPELRRKLGRVSICK